MQKAPCACWTSSGPRCGGRSPRWGFCPAGWGGGHRAGSSWGRRCCRPSCPGACRRSTLSGAWGHPESQQIKPTSNGKRTALLKQDHKLGFMEQGFKGTLLVHPGSCCHQELRQTRRPVWGALFASPSVCPRCWGWTQFPACGICKQRISTTFSAALLTLTLGQTRHCQRGCSRGRSCSLQTQFPVSSTGAGASSNSHYSSTTMWLCSSIKPLWVMSKGGLSRAN